MIEQTKNCSFPANTTGCLKKLSCRFAINIISISSQLAAGSPNTEFDKAQFFFETPCTISN